MEFLKNKGLVLNWTTASVFWRIVKGKTPKSVKRKTQRNIKRFDGPVFIHRVEKPKPSFNFINVVVNAEVMAAKIALEKDEQRYIKKAVCLVGIGGVIILIGLILTILHFKYTLVFDRNSWINAITKITGPVTLASGLLTCICGFVWIPVIREKYKKKQHEESMKMR